MQKIIYALGTKVAYNDKASGSFGPAGRETVVCEVYLHSGRIEYSTLESACVAHEALDWVADPTPESLALVIDAYISDEYCDEDEDEDEYEYEESDDEYEDDEESDDEYEDEETKMKMKTKMKIKIKKTN